MFAVKHNIPEIRDKLLRLKTLVGKSPNWQDDVRRQLEKARKTVANLTPRSMDEGSQRGKHIADGWTLRIIGGGGKDRVPLIGIIYNRFTHKATGDVREGAKLKSVAGMRKAYSLLEVLEYGSPPHTIRPSPRFRKIKGGRSGASVSVKGRQFLRFETRQGKVVFTKLVHHPGTKPYGMVRLTRVVLARYLKKLTKRWERKIKQEWAR